MRRDRFDEVIAEATAAAVITEVAEVVDLYFGRDITTGEALDRIAHMGSEAERLRLAAGWDFFGQKAA